MFNLHRHDPRLLVFLALSLLLHGALAALLTWWPQDRPLPDLTPPLYVEMKELPQLQPRELDVPVPAPAPERHTPARRLGPENQIVPRETVPPASRTEPSPPAPAGPSTPPAQTAAPPPGNAPALPQLSRNQLYASLDRAAHNVVSAWQEKHRAEVERGDAVWFDMEKDLLSSFFSRFRDAIYLVWDYPAAAAQRGEEGTALIKIDINRAGLVEEARILESSGSPRLDAAAVEAVYKAAPHYGYLPNAYPKDKLTIYAFFRYQLGARPAIYGGH